MAAKVARMLRPVPPRLTLPPLSTDPAPFRDGIPIGSGEGIAEAFYGSVRRPTGEVTVKGEPKWEKVRARVRHNVFIYVDEGKALISICDRAGSVLGETLRTAITGGGLGQSNAREETTRDVPEGSYSLGIVIGFQPKTALPLLKEAELGTPQRFLWASATDPSVPDDYPSFPGPLNGIGTDPRTPGTDTPFTGVMSADQQIVNEVRARNTAQVHGSAEVTDNNLDSHELLMRSKLAGLLAYLDGQMHITIEHWELSRVMWKTSCAVRDSLLAYGREVAEQERERRDDDATNRAVRIAAEIDGKNVKLERLARTLTGKVAAAGGQMTHGKGKQALHSRSRGLYNAVVQHAGELGLLGSDDNGITVLSSQEDRA